MARRGAHHPPPQGIRYFMNKSSVHGLTKQAAIVKVAATTLTIRHSRRVVAQLHIAAWITLSTTP
jgi:hypothetical protein